MAVEMHLQHRSGLTRDALLTDHALNMAFTGERSARRAGNSSAWTNSYWSAESGLAAKRRHRLCLYPDQEKCRVREGQ